ncbi:unnamed protein product [Effrenium voratum]|nr:unnamed protein product [Effrenium voratum]
MTEADVQTRWADALGACPLVAILRGVEPAEAVAVGRALLEAGVTILEVPLNSPEALKSIRSLVQQLPASTVVGAGTVLHPKEVEDVKAAGGILIVSPNMDEAVIKKTKELGLVSAPGVCTPTEAFSALKCGADALKALGSTPPSVLRAEAFPGEMLPPKIIKAWRAVLPKSACVLAVGGVNVDNMKAYLEAGANGFGVGTALFSPGDSAEVCRQKAETMLSAFQDLSAGSSTKRQKT